jgi:hypothetical protein
MQYDAGILNIKLYKMVDKKSVAAYN